MIGTEVLEKVVRAALLSATVENDDIQALSLVIVAPVENGKTTLAVRNSGKRHLVLSDLSGMGMLEAMNTERSATHIIINDLTVVTGHRHQVAKLTMSILNALAEEGCYRVAVPRLAHLSLEGRKIGVIACCIPELYKDNRQWWKRSGFASRLLPLIFYHSINLQLTIHEAIAKGTVNSKKTHSDLVIPETQTRVTIPSDIARQLHGLAMQIAKFYGEVGYRRHRQLRSLACGLALDRRATIVGKEDYEFILEAVPHLTTGKEI